MSRPHAVLGLLLTTLFAASNALAGMIVSGDGSENCALASAEACAARAISVHQLWQGNDPNGRGASWISYADTGVAGSTFARGPEIGLLSHGRTPIMRVRETLTGIRAGDRLVMDLWADDTADVSLHVGDGRGGSGGLLAQLLAPDFSQDICAAGPSGCQPEDRAHFEYTFSSDDLTAANGGPLYLDFAAFQVGTGHTNRTNPFGLLYSGFIESAGAPIAVDEPPALGLAAFAGVLSLAGLRRRRRY